MWSPFRNGWSGQRLRWHLVEHFDAATGPSRMPGEVDLATDAAGLARSSESLRRRRPSRLFVGPSAGHWQVTLRPARSQKAPVSGQGSLGLCDGPSRVKTVDRKTTAESGQTTSSRASRRTDSDSLDSEGTSRRADAGQLYSRGGEAQL